MLQSTRAVVIHTFPYSDTSVILRAYTEKLGFASFLLKGFKKNKKQKALLHSLAIVEISFLEKSSSTLHFSRGINTQNPHTNLLLDPLKSSVAMFIAEWLSHTVKEDEEGDVRFFSWLIEAIEILNTSELIANFHLWFLIELSRFMGFGPQGERTIKTPLFSLAEGSFTPRGSMAENLNENESILIDQLIKRNYIQITDLSINKRERANLLYLFHVYFQLHLDKEFKLKSLEILKQLYD